MSKIISRTVRSLDELTRACSAINKKMRWRPWWRGHSDRRWQLVPEIFRPGAPRKHEQSMIAAFTSGAPTCHQECPAMGEPFQWLALAQHYGLPTRLLDWTRSAMVATFFVVEGIPADVDACIWALDATTLNKHETGEAEMLHQNSPKVITLASGMFEKNNSQELVLGVYPQWLDQHMAAQRSSFTLHGSGTPIESHQDCHSFLGQIIIPQSAREDIRCQLYILGLRRQTLFPNLSGLVRGIIHDATWGARDDKEDTAG